MENVTIENLTLFGKKIKAAEEGIFTRCGHGRLCAIPIMQIDRWKGVIMRRKKERIAIRY